MPDAPATPPQAPAEILAWEEAHHRRTAAAAWAAGIVSIIGGVVTTIAFNGIPKYDDRVVGIGQALGDLAAGTQIPAGRTVAQLRWIGDHPALFIAGPVLTAIGALLAFFVLAFLFKAARARNPAMNQFPLIAAAIGAVAYAVGSAVVGITRVTAGSGLAADALNKDAVDALKGGAVMVGTLVQLIGSFGLGLAFVLVGLNAMRVGLLSRFMGVLAMIVGATFILPLDQQGIIRSFWLFAVGFLIARRWPRGLPAAWETGTAVPWPSSRPPRGQKADAGAAAPPETPAPQLPAGDDDGPSAGQRRKKRKKK